jgi:PAS domain S-box-containing protein
MNGSGSIDFKKIADHADQPVFSMTAEGKINYANQAFQKLISRSQEELIGVDFLDLISPNQQAVFITHFKEMLTRPTSSRISTLLKDSQNRTHPVTATCHPDLGTKKTNSIYAFLEDQTEHIRITEIAHVLSESLRFTSEPILITDANLEEPGPHILFANSALEEMMGYTSSELSNQSPRIFQGRETSTAFRRQLKETLKAGRHFSGETINYTKQGTPVHVRMEIAPVRNKKGAITHFISVERNISLQKHRELQLQKEKASLRHDVESITREMRLKMAAMDAMIEGHAILRDSCFIYVNQAHATLYGYEAKDLLGNSWEMLFDSSENKRLEAEVIPLLEARRHWKGEVRGCQKSGRLVPIEMQLTYLASGELVCTNQDISERVQARQALSRQNKMLSAISNHHIQYMTLPENMAEGYSSLLNILIETTQSEMGLIGEVQTDGLGDPLLITLALKGIYLDETVSPYWQKTEDQQFEFRGADTALGDCIRSKKTITSDHPVDDPTSIGLPPDHKLLSSFLVLPIIRGEDILGIIILANRKQGYPRSTVHELAPVLTTCGNMIESGRLTKARDQIAEQLIRKTLELSQANLKLRHSNKMKDQFLASMSHELRTPLAGILNLSEALMEKIYGPLTHHQLKYLKTIEDSGRHLLDLINDILDVAKVESGQMHLAWNEYNIADVVESVRRLIKESAQKKKHRLNCSVSDPSNRIVTDRKRLIQILVNLLSNAVKFTPDQGTIQLSVDYCESKDAYTFLVKDNGPGIPRDHHDLIFEPFSQLDGGLNRSHSGTGLGLSLVKQFTTALGGQVELISDLGKGTEFRIVIPRKFKDPMEVCEI